MKNPGRSRKVLFISTGTRVPLSIRGDNIVIGDLEEKLTKKDTHTLRLLATYYIKKPVMLPSEEPSSFSWCRVFTDAMEAQGND